MARSTNAEADAIVDKEYQVLDKGFVRLVDYMGGDDRVVQSARVSYGAGTKTVREDRGLINYLMRNAHTSPFEQVELTFHLKLPLFVFAQLVRHRMASVNAMSARYSVMADEFYLPEPDLLRTQSLTNKQVGEGQLDPEAAERLAKELESRCGDAYGAYQSMLESGMARELARMVLPQNLYTQVYWKQDLHNLFHMLRLRLDWHAQAEIRAYAEVMADITRRVAPMCYEAFEDHQLHARRFSGTEMDALRRMLAGEAHGLEGRAVAEFEAKLKAPGAL